MLKILRDNYFINAIGRLFVFALLRFSKRAKWIAHKYRIYGVVNVNIEASRFRIYSEADDFIANDIYYGLDYETSEFKLIKALVNKSNYFVDVGANTGIFSIFASCVNNDLQVISFEPHPGNLKRLLKNVALNKAPIQSFELAMGNKESTTHFTIPLDDSLSTISSINNNFTENFSDTAFKTIEVKQRTLDSFLKPYPISSRDLIKIDVEYYEPQVLEGAAGILSTAKPWLLLEVLDYSQLVQQFPRMKGMISEDHAYQIESALSSFGYFAYQLQSNGVKLVNSVIGPHENRNFLFAPIRLSNELIPYHTLADSFSPSS